MYSQLVLNGLIEGLVIGLGALAITLPFCISRFPNAATGDSMTLGAYAGLTFAKWTGSLVLGGFLAAICGMLVSLLAYWLVFRRLAGRPVVALLIASIGIGFCLRSVIGLVFGQGQYVFQIPLWRPWLLAGMRVNPLDAILAVVALGTMAAIFAILHLTPIGRRMRALADDTDLARVSGIQPQVVMLWMWGLVGVTSAIAGIVLGIKTVVVPEAGWNMLVPLFAAAVLGGIGSPLGAVAAGLLLGVAQELCTPLVGFTYKISLAFVVLLLVLLVRPSGLFGRPDQVR
ncbi:MAG TPA: branched-chain amino acid ABC transporter permease [Bordetella sp.]